MYNANIVISLFDPQLDHIGNESVQTHSQISRSPILSLSSKTSPLATKYLILVSKDHETAVQNFATALRNSIQKSIDEIVHGENDQKKLISAIDIKILPIEYGDIWNLGKCDELFEKVLSDFFAKHREFAFPKTVLVNLVSSTAAARTALYLNCLKLLRDKWKSSRLIVATDASAKQGKCLVRFKSICVGKPMPVGVLAQGVGTKDQKFIEELNRLEPVITVMHDEKILIIGPTGAGKSELAKLIMTYMKALNREVTNDNCIHQNIAAIAETLIESELFGHEKGAFTDAKEQHKGIFERADKGVVFLDEIDALPRHLQAKLLTVLDGVPFTRVGGTERVESHFLLICGTNADLQEACKNRTFRPDLYERLRTWTIEVPPICVRHNDLETTLQREIGMWKSRTGVQIGFSGRDAKVFFEERAKQYPWPGNFREFHATFVHLAMAANNGRITKNDIEAEFQRMEHVRHDYMPSCSTANDNQGSQNRTEYDLAEVARLACALDACQKCKTASEVGAMIFASRNNAAKRNGTLFNGAASLQRLFGQFGLKATFKQGICSIQKL